MEEGKRVAYRWAMRGINNGPYVGQPPSGRSINVMGINMERIAEGKIVEHRSNPDLLAMTKQLGIIPWRPRMFRVPALQIGSRRIEYSVARGRSRRYTYFRFKADLTLEIVLPRGKSIDLNAAIRSRQGWILKTYDEMARNRRILDDQRVMYDGEYLEIVFEEDREKEEIRPMPATGRVIVRASDRSRVKELVRRWFLKETSRYVVQRLSELSLQQSLTYQRADVREIKNWGYCTKGGRLSFSWQLIALPERLRDYIIMHELAHLSEFNHSPAFRKRLASMCPDHRQREKELDRISPLEMPFRKAS